MSCYLYWRGRLLRFHQTVQVLGELQQLPWIRLVMTHLCQTRLSLSVCLVCVCKFS